MRGLLLDSELLGFAWEGGEAMGGDEDKEADEAVEAAEWPWDDLRDLPLRAFPAEGCCLAFDDNCVFAGSDGVAEVSGVYPFSNVEVSCSWIRTACVCKYVSNLASESTEDRDPLSFDL